MSFKKISSVFAAVVVGMMVFTADAAAQIVPCQGELSTDPLTGEPEIIGLCKFCDIFLLINNIFDFLALVITPTLAVVAFLVGGLTIMFGGASTKARSTGKRIVTYTIIGVVVVLISWVLVNTTINILTGTDEPAGFPWPWHDPACEPPPGTGVS